MPARCSADSCCRASAGFILPRSRHGDGGLSWTRSLGSTGSPRPSCATGDLRESVAYRRAGFSCKPRAASRWGSGVTSWVLDDQDEAQRLRDRAAIAQALAGVDRHLHPVYDHHSAPGEPLLWAADAVCWAVGAGSEWQARIARVLTVRDLRP